MIPSVNQIPFPDYTTLRSSHGDPFKAGDIIFTRRTGYTGSRIDELIFLIQQIVSYVKQIFGLKSSAFSGALHVSIVVSVEGSRVLIADAMPTKSYNLRVVPFWIQDDIRLSKGEPYQYEVFRFNDEKIATKAAEIAYRLSRPSTNLGERFKAERDEKDNALYKNEYSYWAGFKAIVLGSHRFGPHAKEQAYRSAFDELTQAHVSSGHQKRGKKFYCSHFVAHTYQQAETTRIFQKEKLYVPVSYSSMSEAEKREMGFNWAKMMSRCKDDSLSIHMKHFRFDAKYFSPQDFRQLVQNNPSFTHVVDIVPPSA